ncbi:MAG: hypothetical protein ACLUFV_05525 [Acutalibacteraceae bacterium]
MTGYSAYLHVYGAGGCSASATKRRRTEACSRWLTMFDTADPSAVRTENTLVLDELAPVWQASHKMLLVDPARSSSASPHRNGTAATSICCTPTTKRPGFPSGQGSRCRRIRGCPPAGCTSATAITSSRRPKSHRCR